MRDSAISPEAAERFRDLAEHIGEVFWLVRADTLEVLYVSPAFEEVWGQPRETLFEDPLAWADAIDPRDRTQALAQREPGALAAGRYDVQYRIIRPDGTIRWIRDRGFPVKAADGTVHRIAGLAEDVTEHKRVESRLAGHVTRLRELSGAVLSLNSAFSPLQILGLATERASSILAARSAFALLVFHPGPAAFACRPRGTSRSEFWSGMARPEAEVRASAAAACAPTRAGGQRRAGDDGRKRRAASELRVPLSSRGARDLGWLCVGGVRRSEDFTDEDRAILVQLGRVAAVAIENAWLYGQAKRAERRYREMFEGDLTGNFIVDAAGRVVSCNAAFARIFGYGAVDAAIGRPMREVFRDEHAWKVFVRLLRQRGSLEEHELALRHRDGAAVYAIGNVIGRFDASGEPVELRGYLFDVTRRKRLEEQLRRSQKMEAIGRLAGGVAHDFNNMLSVIRGTTQLLLEERAATDALRSDLEEIERAAARASELTGELLAFGRKQILRPRVLDLNAVIRTTAKMLRRVMSESIELELDLAPGLGRVHADADQIERILLNLAGNARDAMPGGGRLTVRTRNASLTAADRARHPYIRPGRYALVTVADTGRGMDAELRDRVFEPFYTTKPQGHGTGLGLSTVYGMVKQSGGYIWVDSEPGQGTAFEIYLPFADRTGESMPPTGQPEAAPEPDAPTVLLIEDEDAVRAFVQRVLERGGYHVLSAADADEALRIAGSGRRIHLLLTDVVMPKRSGYEAARALVRLVPGLPVIYMSGYTDEQIVPRGALDDAEAFLEKPFSPGDLIAVVRSVLDRPADDPSPRPAPSGG